MKKILISMIICLVIPLGLIGFLLPGNSHAAPNLINYQGVLEDSGGTPVTDPSVSMTFRVYDAVTAGTLLWEESQTVSVAGGIYNVLLGSGPPITGSFTPALFSTNNLWLEVEVNAEVLTPRQQVTSVAFALQAEEAATAGDADTVDGSHAIDFAASLHTHPGTDITSQVGDADTVDGAHSAALEESAEIDADILVHAGNASVHHTRYDDPEAVTAMGTKLDTNPLNHDRYTNAEAFSSAAGVDAGTLDGLDSIDFAASSHTHSYGKVAIVAQSGGNYTDPKAAMDDLVAWCGTPGAVNPCLVRIMPGIYDLGNNGLTMQPYVDIEGSGENITTITSTHSAATLDENSATVVGADNAEIRFLTVENLGGSAIALAVYNNLASPKIMNVTATASGGTGNNYGVYNNGSSPTMTNVVALASGGTGSNYGVYNYISSPTMMDVTATVSGGYSSYSVFNNASSPTMINVTVTASGGTYGIGVYNYTTSSSPTMTNVTATASGGTYSYGVWNNSSTPTMTNVTATASGGTSNYGVYNEFSSPTMKEVSSNGIVINGNILFVPASGSNSVNGALLLSVANEITGLGAPSAANPYVIKLDAGIYDLGNNALTMQQYVDVDGSGENTTSITSTHSSASANENSATVVGADNSEMRFLTVENQGGSTYALAVYSNSASPKITNVTATASGGTYNYAIYNNWASPKITNVTATASGGTQNYAIYNYSASPKITNVTVTASGGTISSGVTNHSSSSPTIYNSRISGTTSSVLNSFSTAKIGATMLDGSVIGVGFTCVGAYSASFVALGSGCLY